jgi:hypothetical protein
MIWAILCVVGLGAYVVITTNKKIVDHDHIFTHAIVDCGKGTRKYKIKNWSRNKITGVVKIWPDLADDPTAPYYIECGVNTVQLICE